MKNPGGTVLLRTFCIRQKVSVLFVYNHLTNQRDIMLSSLSVSTLSVESAAKSGCPFFSTFFSTTSWLQKIAFPLKKVQADQSRVWGICSWNTG